MSTNYHLTGQMYFTDLEQIIAFVENFYGKDTDIVLALKETEKQGYYLEQKDEDLEKEFLKVAEEMEKSMHNYFYRMSMHVVRMLNKASKGNSKFKKQFKTK